VEHSFQRLLPTFISASISSHLLYCSFPDFDKAIIGHLNNR